MLLPSPPDCEDERAFVDLENVEFIALDWSYLAFQETVLKHTMLNSIVNNVCPYSRSWLVELPFFSIRLANFNIK